MVIILFEYKFVFAEHFYLPNYFKIIIIEHKYEKQFYLEFLMYIQSVAYIWREGV